MTSFRTNRTTGRKFVARKVRILLDEGYEPKQAVAVAYSIARRKGYRVPTTAKKRKRDSGYVPFHSVAREISRRAG